MQKNIKKEKREAKENNSGGFHAEIDASGRGLSLSVAGVYSIMDFSEEKVILKVKRGRITVLGGELEIAVYENKTVEITGKITGVNFI